MTMGPVNADVFDNPNPAPGGAELARPVARPRARASLSAVLRRLAVPIAIGCLALVLREHAVRGRDFWWDETDVWYDALSGHDDPGMSPFILVLTRFAIGATRRLDPFFLHQIPIVFGALLPVAAYFFGRLLHPRAPLPLALVVTFSPIAVIWSQELRPYAPFMLFATLQLFFLVRAMETPSTSAVALHALFVGLAGLNHMLTVPFTLADVAVFGSAFVLSRTSKGTTAPIPWSRLVAYASSTLVALLAGTAWSWTSSSDVSKLREGHYDQGLPRYLFAILNSLGPWPTQIGGGSVVFLCVSSTLILAFACVGAAHLVRARRTHVLLALLAPSLLTVTVLYETLGHSKAMYLLPPEAPFLILGWARYLTPLTVPYLACVATGAAVLLQPGRPWRSAAVIALLGGALGGGVARWYSWVALPRDAYHRARASGVAALEPRLAGVVFAESRQFANDETDRSVVAFGWFRRDHLPLYRFREGRAFTVVYRTGRFGVTVPELGEPTTVPPGVYAVVGPWWTEKPPCETVDPRFHAPSWEAPAGTRLCELR
jgi:hypothetical protein